MAGQGGRGRRIRLVLLLSAVLAVMALPASAEEPARTTSLSAPLPLRLRAVPQRPPLRLLDGSQPLLLARIKGASMEPLLLDGELAVYIPMSHVSTLHAGEVAIYDSATCPLQAGLVVHRMVQQVEGAYVFRGDANPAPDLCRVTQSMLAGVVIGLLWATGDTAEGVR